MCIPKSCMIRLVLRCVFSRPHDMETVFRITGRPIPLTKGQSCGTLMSVVVNMSKLLNK